MAASVERRAACGASYNAYASGATPRKFETRQPARPAEKRRRTVNFNAELARGGLRLSRLHKCREVSCCVHECDNAYNRFTNTINQAITADEDLTNVRIVVFTNATSSVRKLVQC